MKEEIEKDILSKQALENRIQTERFLKNIEYWEDIDSTNIRAKELAKEGNADGTFVVANAQSAGQGRRGRNWQSRPGENIYMSFVLQPEIPPQNASMLTLVAALAVADGIRTVTGLASQIKWPNDIVIQGKKVCGILTEMSADSAIHYVVVGIGINVNETVFEDALKETATSLRLELGHKINRLFIIEETLAAFETYYQIFLQDKNLARLKETYNKQLVSQNREVKILQEQDEYRAVARGINEAGELMVEKEDGTKEYVMSGEVSVRGVYGYV